MAQHCTPELDDQFPLHPQEIRSAALQAAARTLADSLPDSDAVVNMAAKFETYIEYGRPEAAAPVEDPWVNPGLWVGSITITPEKIEAGREKLMAAIRNADSDPLPAAFVGATVRTTRYPYVETGVVGKIVRIDPGGDAPYWVELDGVRGERAMSSSEFELVPDDTDAPEPCDCPNCTEAHRLRAVELDARDAAIAYPPLKDDLAERLALANEVTDETEFPKWLPDADAAIGVFRERIGAMPSGLTARGVYLALFGDAQ